MKTLIDFLPILLFFTAFKLYDIYVATGVLMAATAVQMLVIYAMDRKLQPMHKITLLMVMGFGALTLAFQDDRFIKWKPTVLYMVMAIGLAWALWGMRKNVLQLLLGSQLDLPAAVWQRLNLAWIVYSLFMAALNGFVVLNYSTEQWVSFKLWGYFLPLAFIVGQGFYIAPHIRASEKPKDTEQP